MTQVDNYLHDGANWQAQAVLAYLRSHYENVVEGSWNEDYHYYTAHFDVGRYENCREQGYIFSLRYWNGQRNYAVYEHRNSDNLCVVVFDEMTINTPEAKMVWNAMGDDKYNVTKKFSFGEIVDCGDYIIEDAQNFISTMKDISGSKTEEC